MGQRGLNALPRVGEASLGKKGTETHLKGLLPSPAGPPRPPSPSLPTSQVGAPVSHGDHHFGGRDLLEAALDGAGVPGHDSLRQVDHDLGRKPGWVVERPGSGTALSTVQGARPRLRGHMICLHGAQLG